MTKEFKVGMTGKTTTGFVWRINHKRETAFHPLKLVVGADVFWVNSTGERAGGLPQEYGDLIHPDDAKEETLPFLALSDAMKTIPASGQDGARDLMRFQAACAVLTGLMANPNVIGKGGAYLRPNSEIELAQMAVRQGDATISALAKDKTND